MLMKRWLPMVAVSLLSLEACATPAHPKAGKRVKAAAGGDVVEGLASFYADSLAGRPTANGETYDPEAHTCAHRSLPFGTVVVVEVVDSGRSATCRINDRGPYAGGRVIDVSRRVARELGIVERGVARVRLRVAPVA
jgi:rare lipoprotein A